jgi:hypothetical protein
MKRTRIEAGLAWLPRPMFEARSIGWWYWLTSGALLFASALGWDLALPLCIALTAVQILHFSVRTGSAFSFAVQVRIAYLLVLLVALPEALRPLVWLPAAGTWIRVLFGYCAMARTVFLLPWNRTEPFSAALLYRTYWSAPVRGCFMRNRELRLRASR